MLAIVSCLIKSHQQVKILLALAGLSFCPIQSVQAAPPPHTFCYGVDCRPTIEEAEALMRAYNGQPGSQYLERNGGTSISEDGTLTINYSVKNRPPEVLGDVEYFGDYVPSSYTCTPAFSPFPSPPPGCAHESEVIANAISYLSSLSDADCSNSNFTIEGGFVSPFEDILALAGQGDPGLITFGAVGDKRIRYTRTCPSLGIAQDLTYALAKFQYFKCETSAGFFPIPAETMEDKLKWWPEKIYCMNNMTASFITTRAIQVDSCAGSKYPCYPATGDKARFEQDFSFASRPFTRAYHSLRQFSSQSLPAGWRFSYEQNIVWNADFFYLIDDLGYLDTFKFADSAESQAISKSGSGRILRRVPSDLVQGFTVLQSNGDVSKFDIKGYLLSIENANDVSRNLTLTYPASGWSNNGRPISATDNLGRSLLFDYIDNRLDAIYLPDGGLVQYGYDSSGNLETVNNNGDVRRYQYDLSSPGSGNEGLLVGIVDESGNAHAKFAYDSRGRVIASHLYSIGLVPTETTTLTYPGDNLATLTTSSNEVVSYYMDSGLFRKVLHKGDSSGWDDRLYSGGNLLQKVDPAGAMTQYNYSGAWLSAINFGVNTPVEKRRTMSHDANGHLLRTDLFAKVGSTYTLKSTSRKTFNASGSVKSSCEADGSNAAAVAYVCGSSANAPVGVRQISYLYCEQTDVTAGTCPVVGLVRSIDGARTNLSDSAAFTYYASDDPLCGSVPTSCSHRKGDLWKVTNALGHPPMVT